MKKNDKIKCIDSFNSDSLRVGIVYEVNDINQHGNIQVRESESRKLLAHYYKQERFKLDVEGRAKIVPTKKYKTKNGLDVVFLSFDSGDPTYPVVGMIRNKNGTSENATWSIYGEQLVNDTSEFDLVEVKIPIVKFIIVNQENKVVSAYYDYRHLLPPVAKNCRVVELVEKFQ